ncbi:hypothetical protein DN730_08145 [Marinomonas piezotolerans]|uniref:Uncharacterized protein n=1 Tax=Marinomonas piezotolerans TaxID=2213058 RepID=A0A370U9C0_9GAMM|nr:hypothetical protein [Marinomonas piezotolerans]RDL44365.1 hypothetical protein DN730_08145 [Marinomonas piezotolerans]
MANRRKRPAIEHVQLKGELSSLNSVLAAIREHLEINEGERGDPMERGVKVRDLVAAGISEYRLRKSGKGQYATLTGTQTETHNTSTPPTPQNLQALPTTANVYLSWGNPSYSYHAYTEVWRSSENNLATAVDLGASPDGLVYADAVVSGQTYYYWIRFVSKAGVKSEFNAVDGVEAVTELPPEEILNQLSGRITSSELVQELRDPIEQIPLLSEAIGTETENRIAAILAESQARADAIQAEVDARIAAITQERATSAYEISVEQTTRAQKLAEEAQARIDALQSEADQRVAAIQTEQAARATAIANEQQARANEIQQEAQIRANALAAESLNRIKGFQALQSIESLVGTDARELKTLSRIANEEMTRMQQYQELSASYQTLYSTTSAEIIRLDEAVATEKEARATAITSLTAQFQTELGTVQQAAVTEAINVITTNDDVIAEVISKISAADTTGWATTAYVTENAVTPLNALTNRTTTLESQYQAIDSTYLSQASFTEWQQTYTTDKEATTERLDTLESTVSDPLTGLTSKASTTQLTQTKNDIYNSQVSQFGSISARFIQQQGDIDAKATKTELTDAISDAKGASVSEFTQIQAEFDNVANDVNSKASKTEVEDIAAGLESASIEQASNSKAVVEFAELSAMTESIKSLQQSVTADQSLISKIDKVTAEYRTGISTATAEITRVETVLSDELSASVESFEAFTASYETDKANTLATKTELNQAKTDVLGAEVSEFSRLEAKFNEQNSQINTKASTADLSNAISTEQEARANLASSVATQLNSQQQDIDTRATKTELTEAISTEQQARTSQYNSTQSEISGLNDSLKSKASTTELEETAAALDSSLYARLNLTATALKQDAFTAETRAIKSIEQSANADAVQIKRLDRMESEYKTGVGLARAEIAQTQTILTNSVEALAETVTTHKTEYETDKSSTLATKTELDQAKSDIKGSAVTDFTEINTQLESQQQDIATRATKTELNEAISGESNARVSAINQLSTTVNGHTSTLQTQSESIDGIGAKWGVKFSIGNDGQQRVTGFQVNAGEGSTGAHFDVDEFSISKPGAEALDFAVADVLQPDGSTKRMVVMDAAKIVNLAVKSAQIESVAADKVTAGKINAAVSMMAAKIFGGALRLGAGGTILRDDENGDSAGYKAVIDSDGSIYSEAHLRVGNEQQYIHWNGETFEISGILKSSVIDPSSTLVKSSENATTGPITVHTLNTDVLFAKREGVQEFGSGYIYSESTYIGKLYLPKSDDTSEPNKKVVTDLGQVLNINFPCRGHDCSMNIQYRLDGGDWITWEPWPNSTVTSVAGATSGNFYQIVNLDFPLFGPNGVTDANDHSLIEFQFQVDSISGQYGRFEASNISFTYNNL